MTAIIKLHGDTDRQSIAQRIDVRLRILTAAAQKIRAGELIEFDIPSSLNKIRLWNLPEMGIFPINYTNAFVTTHAEFGTKVLEISRCLKLIKEGVPKALRTDPLAERQEVKPSGVRVRELEEALRSVVSQVQLLRISLEAEKGRVDRERRRADNAEAELVSLRTAHKE